MRIGPNGEKDTLIMDFGYRANHTLLPDHDGFGKTESNLAELLAEYEKYEGLTPGQSMQLDIDERKQKRNKERRAIEWAKKIVASTIG
jgi:hypothetical protein